MSSEPPKPGAIPGWGQPADPSPTEPVAPAAPGAPAQTGWGQPPDAAPQPPATPAPAPPAGPPPTPAPPAPAPQAPPQAGGWGAPPAPGMAAGVPPAGAGAPPNWNPAPAAPSGSNGCLKACLIIGAILVVLFFIAAAGIVFLGNQIIKSVPVDSEGNLASCAIVSDADLSTVLGSGTQAIPLEGVFDTLLGLVLDKRVIPDAEDCFLSSDKGNSGTGRIARYTGSDAAGDLPAGTPEGPADLRGPRQRAHARDRGLLRRRRVRDRRRSVLHRDLERVHVRRAGPPGRHPRLREPGRRRWRWRSELGVAVRARPGRRAVDTQVGHRPSIATGSRWDRPGDARPGRAGCRS